MWCLPAEARGGSGSLVLCFGLWLKEKHVIRVRKNNPRQAARRLQPPPPPPATRQSRRSKPTNQHNGDSRTHAVPPTLTSPEELSLSMPLMMGTSKKFLKRSSVPSMPLRTKSTIVKYSTRLFWSGDPVSAIRRFVRIFLMVRVTYVRMYVWTDVNTRQTKNAPKQSCRRWEQDREGSV